MAWRKVTLGEDENLQCDISEEDVYAAVHDLRNQLMNAGVVLVNKSAQKPNRRVVIRRKTIIEKAVSSKTSSRARAKSSERKRKNLVTK